MGCVGAGALLAEEAAQHGTKRDLLAGLGVARSRGYCPRLVCKPSLSGRSRSSQPCRAIDQAARCSTPVAHSCAVRGGETPAPFAVRVSAAASLQTVCAVAWRIGRSGSKLHFVTHRCLLATRDPDAARPVPAFEELQEFIWSLETRDKWNQIQRVMVRHACACCLCGKPCWAARGIEGAGACCDWCQRQVPAVQAQGRAEPARV